MYTTGEALQNSLSAPTGSHIYRQLLCLLCAQRVMAYLSPREALRPQALCVHKQKEA